MSSTPTTEQLAKLDHLKGILQGLEGAAVAFSGGVDSTFLLAVAHEVLGPRAFAITASSCVYPQSETDFSSQFCTERGIHQETLFFDALGVEGFAQNPKNRCYICKKQLLALLTDVALKTAARLGISHVAIIEGSNASDRADYRPGAQAVEEAGLLSPLDEADLTKDDIRALSNMMGLPTWNKPSFA